jgi:hypothetical protein
LDTVELTEDELGCLTGTIIVFSILGLVKYLLPKRRLSLSLEVVIERATPTHSIFWC